LLKKKKKKKKKKKQKKIKKKQKKIKKKKKKARHSTHNDPCRDLELAPFRPGARLGASLGLLSRTANDTAAAGGLRHRQHGAPAPQASECRLERHPRVRRIRSQRGTGRTG
jgi:outer membrane biosynthesis protein TonB